MRHPGPQEGLAMKHGDTQLGAPLVIYKDTKANIVALTGVAEGSIAYLTDERRLLIHNGTNWQTHILPLGSISGLPDMGAIPFIEDWGYGQQDISSKYLHNVVIRGFVQANFPLEKGAIRLNQVTNTLELYNGTIWLTVITLTLAQVNDWMLRSNWNTLSVTPTTSLDTENKTVMTLGFVDMGAIPADVILDGGVLI